MEKFKAKQLSKTVIDKTNTRINLKIYSKD